MVGWRASAICLHDLVLFAVAAFAASIVYVVVVRLGSAGERGLCVAVRTIPMRCSPVLSLNLTRVPGVAVTFGMVTAKGAVESSACHPRWVLISAVHSGSVVSQMPPERMFAQMVMPSACRRSNLVRTLNSRQPRLMIFLLHFPEMLSTRRVVGALSGKRRSAQCSRMPFCDVHSQSLASHWLLPMDSSTIENLRSSAGESLMVNCWSLYAAPRMTSPKVVFLACRAHIMILSRSLLTLSLHRTHAMPAYPPKMTSLAFLPLRPHLLRRTSSTCLCRESISSHEAGVNFNLYRIRGNMTQLAM